jgi:hypothetical protein
MTSRAAVLVLWRKGFRVRSCARVAAPLRKSNVYAQRSASWRSGCLAALPRNSSDEGPPLPSHRLVLAGSDSVRRRLVLNNGVSQNSYGAVM